MATGTGTPNPGRALVAASLAKVCDSSGDFEPVTMVSDRLDVRDRRLALRILRHGLQRWITIEHLLERFLRQPVGALEPVLRGILVSAAAQLLFMDRQPAHAVVNDSVQLARDRVRPGAGGLANAVLRRLHELIDRRFQGIAWRPGSDRLPLEDGYVRFVEPCLPPPCEWQRHLSLATSHPPHLIARWSGQFGRTRTVRMCLNGLRTPPTIVAVEPGEQPPGLDGAAEPHADAGFVLWRRSRDELSGFLSAHPSRRVQDPGAAEPIRALAGSAAPLYVLDYCAGLGTKTAQLLDLYGDARIVATDVQEDRLAELRRRFAGQPNVQVVEPQSLRPFNGRVDLLVLDVPCSNTAVLSRRPEARYRYGAESIGSLLRLQRDIATRTVPLLSPRGTVLYSTCSLDEAENQQQVRWICERFDLYPVQSALRLPRGRERSYRDGCFYSIMRASG